MMSCIKFIDVYNKKIKITEFKEKHITANYVKWLNDNAVVRYSEQRHYHHTIKSCFEYYSQMKRSGNYFLAIEIFDEQEWKHIGNLGATVDQDNRIADLAILIGDKSQWGKGFGASAWCLAADSLIELLDLRFITAGTMAVNQPMINIFERSEMKIESTLPRRFLFEGSEVDLVIASGQNEGFKRFLKKN